MSPKVSIITLTYNHKAYIGQCIESVMSQTMTDWEMIIVDDGSSDGTDDIVRELKDHRIKFYPRPHRGITSLASNYNLALSHATGQFVAILEGDDYWPPNNLAVLSEALTNSHAVMAYGISQCVDFQGKNLERLSYPSSKTMNSRFYPDALANRPVGSAVKAMLMLDTTFSATCGILIRRAALESMGGFQSPRNGVIVDRPTYFHLGLRGEFLFVPEVTGYYRRHPGNMTTNIDVMEKTIGGLLEYIDTFVGTYSSSIDLLPKDQAHIKSIWRNNLSGIHIMQGRKFLLDREWRLARQKFLRALSLASRPSLRTYAIGSYLISFARLNVEWIFGFLRRPTLSRSQ